MMAEIRCPMCGKENPGHLDVCQFCQARLKPLGSIPSDSSSIFPEDLNSDDELPDWMEFEADFGDSDDSTPFEGGTDDWMSRLGGDTEAEGPASPLDEDQLMSESRAAARMDFNNNGIPDWMEDLEKDRATPPLEMSQDPFDREIPDFFATDQDAELPADEDESGAQLDWFMDSSGEDEESPAPAQEGGLPDWLVSSDESDELEEVGSANHELPDFFSDRDQEDLEPTRPIAESGLPETSGYVGQETLPISDFEDDLPDWLSEAGGDEVPPSEEGLQPTFAPDDGEIGLPDWLTSEESEDETKPVSEGDIPDWLSNFESSEPAPQETAHPAEASAADLPDWLKDASEQEETPVAGFSEAADALPPFDMDTGDLRGMLSDEATEIESAAPASEGDLPDWLSGDMEEEAEPKQPAAEGVLPDWLSDLSGQEAPPAETPKAPKPFDMDTGDLESMLAEATAELEESGPPPEREVPDWLSPTATAAAAVAAGTSISDEDDIPDWLSGFEEESEPQEMAATPSESSDADLPDWLSDFSAQEDALAAEPPKAPKPFDMDTGDLESMLADASAELEKSAPASESDLPDWLAGEVEEDAEPIQPAAGGDLPDWLSDDLSTDQEPAEPAEAADIPEWLAGFDSEDAKAAPSAMEAEEEELLDWFAETEEKPANDHEEAIPDWLKDSVAGVAGAAALSAAASAISSDEEEKPDWLSDLDGVGRSPEETSVEESFDLGESRAIPSWLQDAEPSLEDIPLGSTPPSDAAESVPFTPTDDIEDEDIFEFDQLPGWISEEPVSDIDQPQEITGPTEDLSPAELPGWLAAMRPVESSTSAEAGEVERGPMENSGPLAGLYSVLVAEPEISRLKKPPTYSNKLQITDSQQAHASLLQELLETEGKPQSLPLPSLISSQRIFRLVLSIIIVVIAFLAVIAGGDIATMPQAGTIPPGVFETSDLVNSLSSSDTALIAFDYEPGLSGEMDAASSAVVDSMMLKGAKLALVSTSPTGPALAERFINGVQSQHSYQSGIQYVNLGFIPGGVTGLAAFAANPRWVAPNTLEGLSAWETAPLTNIGQVSDFALVMVITDNPNTAQAWVEQVNPKLGTVPLVAVVSAQVEPMVRPYFDNQQGQIDGLISGLTGGAAYEVTSRPNIARSYWDAFNILLIVIVSCILIGGAINVISTLMAQRKEPGEEAE